MAEICVVVDNHHLEPLLNDSNGATGSLRLTTIRSGQKRALIEIKSKSGRRTTTLYSIVADGLQGEKPNMEVRGSIEDRDLSLEFLLRDEVFHRATVRLSAPRHRPWWIAIPVILVTAAVLLLLLPREEESVNEAIHEEPPPVEAAEALPVPPPMPLSQTVYFLPDDATLTADTRNSLDGLLTSLGEEDDWLLEITGHCALAGTEKGRVDLSWMRAQEVLSYLTTAGFAPAREPEINGVGGNEPVTRDPDLQHQNRRAEITASATARAAGSG